MWIFIACDSDATVETGKPGETDAEETDQTGETDSDSVPTDPDWSAYDDWGARYDCGGMDPAEAAPLGGKVALTFDDGPDPDVTPRVLEILREHEVPATFFYIGDMAAEPDADWIIEDVAADPLFDIGNHSWDHEDMSWWDARSAAGQLDPVIELLAEYGVSPRYFRFPYGGTSCDVVDLARERGMHITGWNIDPADWCYAMGDGTCSDADYWRVPDRWASDMVGNTIEQLVESDGGVILFHDVWDFTADHLEEIIVEARAAGLVFTSLDDVSAFPHLNADQPERLPWMGMACELATDPCWQVENFSWCEPGLDADDGVCVLSCADQPCFSRDGGPASACVWVADDWWCLAEADELNGDCAGAPGTVKTEVDGLQMCVPEAWL